MGLNLGFWQGRSVFVTGHTGFKGGWISRLLTSLGAKVYGYALEPPNTPNFFDVVKLGDVIHRSVVGDIRDFDKLSNALRDSKASVVIHMAAQPLVRESFRSPVETFATNVLGTVHVLESVRCSDSVRAVVNVTTDKCYENREWLWAYRETDKLGGYDPYSCSKACAELAASAYRRSFLASANVRVASVRAGNVIGGGDWSPDRLLPDFLRAVDSGKTLSIRSPDAIRPWQHVLEPLSGYLMLAQKLVEVGGEFADSWNFGPEEIDAKPVSWIVEKLCRRIPESSWELDTLVQPHEASLLKLDSSKAKSLLGWVPRWTLDIALANTVDWHLAWKRGENMDHYSLQQIEAYLKS